MKKKRMRKKNIYTKTLTHTLDAGMKEITKGTQAIKKKYKPKYISCRRSTDFKLQLCTQTHCSL